MPNFMVCFFVCFLCRIPYDDNMENVERNLKWLAPWCEVVSVYTRPKLAPKLPTVAAPSPLSVTITPPTDSPVVLPEKKPEVRPRRLSRVERKRSNSTRRNSAMEPTSIRPPVMQNLPREMEMEPLKPRVPLELVLAVTKCDTIQHGVSSKFRAAVAQFCHKFNLRVTYLSVKNGDEVRQLFRYGALRSLHTYFLEHLNAPPPAKGAVTVPPLQDKSQCSIM